MKLLIFVFLGLFLIPATLNAETQVSNLVGSALSVDLGESPYAPVFKNTVTWTKKELALNNFRIENNFVFNAANKLESNRGWFVVEGIDFLIPLKGSLFLDTGIDYRYRNGGNWVKQAVFSKLGGGLKFKTSETRLVFRKEMFSVKFPNDPSFFEFLPRPDQPFNNLSIIQFLYRLDQPLTKSWKLRVEYEPGFVRYTQSNQRQSGFYFDVFVGFVFIK